LAHRSQLNIPVINRQSTSRYPQAGNQLRYWTSADADHCMKVIHLVPLVPIGKKNADFQLPIANAFFSCIAGQVRDMVGQQLD